MAALTYAVILPAELPDKSLLATVVLGTRHRGALVLAGVTGAFAVHVVLAVAAGGLLNLLPKRVLELIVLLLFAGGAVLLLRGEEEHSDVLQAPPPTSPWRVVAVSFGVVFVGEWGDITQLATANLAARYDDPYSVGIGALLALVSAAALAVLLGSTLTRRVPLETVRRGAGVLMAILAVLAAVSLIRG